MKKQKLSAILAMIMALSLCACDQEPATDGDSATDETTAETTITSTARTVAVNTEALQEEEQNALAGTLAKLPDVTLENKEVKWLAHYDLNPDGRGMSKSVQLELFEQKYGGSVKYYPTTWNERYSDLSTYVLGGEGIDIYPGIGDALPKGIVSGMFQPIDEYVDLNDPNWAHLKNAAELYNFGGSHYAFVCSAVAEHLVIYNTTTIDEHGLTDPWDLYKDGNWNWETFKEQLLEYVDVEAEQYGLDGYWAEKGLRLTTGVPVIGTKDGEIVNNIDHPDLEKALNFQNDLYNSGLVFPREQFDHAEQPHFMGEGKELFYISGAWQILKDPNTWTVAIPPENVGVVPMPQMPDGEAHYALMPDGYNLCKGAGNPEGAALFAECGAVASADETAKEIANRKSLEDYQLSQDILDKLAEIDQLAQENPVFEFSAGASSDIASITTEGGTNVGVSAPMHGVDWATEKARISAVLNQLVDELKTELKAVQAE